MSNPHPDWPKLATPLQYFYIDLETTARGGPGDGLSPEAHWDANHVLLCAHQIDGHGAPSVNRTPKELLRAMADAIDHGFDPVIVAHNAKFDIKHLMKYGGFNGWARVKVWCTMTWEYRNSGHLLKFPSLQDTCLRRNIFYDKGIDLGALIVQGVRMEDIPIKDLTFAIKNDVRSLYQLWLQQNNLHNAYDMQYILPLSEMEMNGLKVDQPKMEQLYIEKQNDIMAEEQRMMQHIMTQCEWQDGSAVNITEDFTSAVGLKSKEINMFARRTLSFLLTSVPDTLEITTKWKLKWKQGWGPIYAEPHPAYFKGKTHLGYVIDEKVFSADTSWVTTCAERHRKAEKIISTYLAPMAETIAIRGTVHPKLNTAQTATGRLSSSQPNGQNMPPVVRELIIPHNKVNQIYEIDFKQLEMYAVAIISGCGAMQAALARGDDLHYLSGRTVMGWQRESDMTKDDRRTVKAVNFGILYGGKANGLSQQTGIKKSVVQALIDGFFTAFPGVAKWQKAMFEEVVEHMYTYDIKDGEQRYASLWTLPLTGRKFAFVEQPSPLWLRKRTHRKHSFSPTQTSNYPIQGCAGGDLVMYALYWLWLNKANYKYLLTVHDSIIIETDESSVSVQAAVLDMCAATTAHFNLPISLQCDVDHGKHWK